MDEHDREIAKIIGPFYTQELEGFKARLKDAVNVSEVAIIRDEIFTTQTAKAQAQADYIDEFIDIFADYVILRAEEGLQEYREHLKNLGFFRALGTKDSYMQMIEFHEVALHAAKAAKKTRNLEWDASKGEGLFVNCIYGIETILENHPISVKLKEHGLECKISHSREKARYSVPMDPTATDLPKIDHITFKFTWLPISELSVQDSNLLRVSNLIREDRITFLCDERITEIKKLEKKQNLKALAAQNSEGQRNLAETLRSVKGYNSQKEIFSSCPYCFGELGEFSGDGCTHLDHIYPVSKGGLSTRQNTVFVCETCNLDKSNLTLSSFCSTMKKDLIQIHEVLQKLGKDF